MKALQVKSVVWKEGKFYVAQCLNVDVSSFGKTKKEALKNLTEALALYFEDSKRLKVPIVSNAQLVRLSLKDA